MSPPRCRLYSLAATGLHFSPAPDAAKDVLGRSRRTSLPEGHLDPARRGLLAGALEDAGCTDAELLGHLRGPGLHVRGCWALDLVLGKN
jgi:hypothetical protein